MPSIFASREPLPAQPTIGLKIAGFLAALALVFAGVMYGSLAATAYLSGDLVGAIGKGADEVAKKTATDPDTASASTPLKETASSAKTFAKRAKLIALGIAAVAALLFLGGELVRRRYTSKAVPVVLGIAAAGQGALAILLGGGLLLAIGIAACAFGAFVWTRSVKAAAALSGPAYA
jgi:uncharacterized membrane protein YgcG